MKIKRRNPVAHASGKVNRAVTHANKAKALKVGAKPKHRRSYEDTKE